MAYRYEIETLPQGAPRGNTHRAVIYRDGKKVSVHGTRKGAETVEDEAKRVIKFYERQEKRDRALA